MNLIGSFESGWSIMGMKEGMMGEIVWEFLIGYKCMRKDRK